MALKQETQDINGHKWTTRQFPARMALGLKVRLIKVFGPAIAELLPALGSVGALTSEGGAESEEATMAALGAIPRAVESLASHVDPDDFIRMVMELLKQTSRDDTTISEDYFDENFAGNYAELYKGLAFVLKVNYAGFFGMLGRLGIGQPQMSSDPKTPKM